MFYSYLLILKFFNIFNKNEIKFPILRHLRRSKYLLSVVYKDMFNNGSGRGEGREKANPHLDLENLQVTVTKIMPHALK